MTDKQKGNTHKQKSIHRKIENNEEDITKRKVEDIKINCENIRAGKAIFKMKLITCFYHYTKATHLKL